MFRCLDCGCLFEYPVHYKEQQGIFITRNGMDVLDVLVILGRKMIMNHLIDLRDGGSDDEILQYVKSEQFLSDLKVMLSACERLKEIEKDYELMKQKEAARQKTVQDVLSMLDEIKQDILLPKPEEGEVSE